MLQLVFGSMTYPQTSLSKFYMTVILELINYSITVK